MVDAAKLTPSPVTGPFTADSLMLLHRALEWWVGHGFRYVDLPWMVPKEFSDATRPPECRDIQTLHGSFVASGEQSFLQLWQAGQLWGAQGYVGWTPCLRDDVLDEFHQHGFMKAEWFVPLMAGNAGSWDDRLHHLVDEQARLFCAMAQHAGERSPVRVDVVYPGAEQIDLMLNGVEIGSYGRRTFDGRQYLYGTALALPRFTQALASVPADC